MRHSSCQACNYQLGIALEPEEVAIAHRVASQKSPSPIIVRFVSHAVKMRVLRARRELKGTGTSIGEDLCRDLMAVYHRVRNDSRVKSVWAWNGKVFIKDSIGNIQSVLYGQSLDDILGDEQSDIIDDADMSAQEEQIQPKTDGDGDGQQVEPGD